MIVMSSAAGNPVAFQAAVADALDISGTIITDMTISAGSGNSSGSGSGTSGSGDQGLVGAQPYSFLQLIIGQEASLPDIAFLETLSTDGSSALGLVNISTMIRSPGVLLFDGS